MPNAQFSNKIVIEDLQQIVTANLPWENFSNKIIMVTGAGGFLAAYLIKSILAADDLYRLNLKIICVARGIQHSLSRLSDYLIDSRLTFVKADISQSLPSHFPRADFIIHCASQASPKFFGEDPVGTLKANSMGTYYLLEHATKTDCERFLFFSSGEIYGNAFNSDRELTEDEYGYLDPMQVRSCYAESKRMGETMCVAWSKQYDLFTLVVRPFHTYGPGLALDDGRVFADFVRDVVEKRDIVLRSNGLAQRPFCYISDATQAFLMVLLKGGRAQAYNVANPNAEISMKDLATTISSLFPERGI
jgi:nucleoside-diphosphate-sugar epimerase